MTVQLTPPTILDRLSQVVRHRPDHPAVVQYGTYTYSYAQLWQEASYIASCLKCSGIGKECIVAIAWPKSYQYIAAVLGIWMAGAAFVPLDTTMPDERIGHILNQSLIHNSGQVIAALAPEEQYSRLQALLPQLLFMPVKAPSLYKSLITGGIKACSDRTLDNAQATKPEQFCPATLAPQDLAYVIFTSGSTGKPKGVLVEHRGLVNLLEQQIKAFALDKDSRSLFYLSTNFDASISDFGTALMSGATLYIEKPEDLVPGKALFDLIKERGITYVDIPPSALRLMDPEQVPACLKSMVIGGEVCPRDVVAAFAKKLRLVCVYGPTEATVCTSWTHCQPDQWQAPLIGKPISGIQYKVMDQDGVEVAPGKAGELYISGIGLARGYLNNATMTEQRFVTIDGIRYYLSRDFVAATKDGNYEFLGRVDRQFKLRGMLIEPEEIEKYLAEHKQIARAAVLKRTMPDNPERAILVAFVQAHQDKHQRPDSIELREHLARSLPRWMLPQRYQWLDNMPQTSSGKVDIKILSEIPLDTASHYKGLYGQDQSELAKGLRQAVEQLLGYDHLQDEDNFFDLGLDSLAVIELSAMLSTMDVEISPHTIFQNPSIKSLIANSKSNLDTTDVDALSASYLKTDVLHSDYFRQLKIMAEDQSKSTRTKSRCMLITGATGFLGARILGELLRPNKTDGPDTIYAIVRAPDQVAAGQRLLAAAKASDRERIAEAIKKQRLLPLPGDLLSPDLTLDTAMYEHLAKTVDCIVHLAARVNMVQPYTNLKAENVTGSLNLAKLALTGQNKNMHYASTLSVFVSTDQNTGTVLEDDQLQATNLIWGGYSQSKWIAEVALKDLASQGFNLNTYRLGLITGDTADGATGSHDFLAMFIRGLRSMGAVPEESLGAQGERLALDITPVDWAARAMAALILDRNGTSQTFHLASSNALTLSRLVRLLLNTQNDLPLVKMAELQSRQSTLDQQAAAAYLSLCRLHNSSGSIFNRHRVMDLFQATDIKFDCKNCIQALAKLPGLDFSPTCPAATDELISMYIREALSKTKPVS